MDLIAAKKSHLSWLHVYKKTQGTWNVECGTHYNTNRKSFFTWEKKECPKFPILGGTSLCLKFLRISWVGLSDPDYVQERDDTPQCFFVIIMMDFWGTEQSGNQKSYTIPDNGEGGTENLEIVKLS